MPNFQKKEVVVANQWFPGNKAEGVQGDDPNMWCGCVIMGGPCDKPHVHSSSYTGGALLVVPGDWIVADPDGVHYDIIKPDVFEETFKQVEG